MNLYIFFRKIIKWQYVFKQIPHIVYYLTINRTNILIINVYFLFCDFLLLLISMFSSMKRQFIQSLIFGWNISQPFIFLAAASSIFELDHFSQKASVCLKKLLFPRHPFSFDHSVTPHRALLLVQTSCTTNKWLP